jgi:YD repeat-containing protein
MENRHFFVSSSMKTTILILCISCFAITGQAQHYYNDLVATGEQMKKRAVWLQQRVKSVRFNSYDNNNQPIEGFKCEQIVKNNFTEITTITTTALAGTTENTAFFNTAGQLIKTVDTSDGNKTVITYAYDANNRLTNITSIATSPGNYSNKEQHLWSYDAAGKPQRMLKIKNNTDTTYITFVPDEKGNPGEEKSIRQGQEQPTRYYYYDDNNRLTDIVRYIPRVKKLFPDYIFEYDAQDRVTSMLVTIEGTGDYQKWLYTYDEKGLKIKDECYSKTKVLIGKIEYKYQF